MRFEDFFEIENTRPWIVSAKNSIWETVSTYNGLRPEDLDWDNFGYDDTQSASVIAKSDRHEVMVQYRSGTNPVVFIFNTGQDAEDLETENPLPNICESVERSNLKPAKETEPKDDGPSSENTNTSNEDTYIGYVNCGGGLNDPDPTGICIIYGPKDDASPCCGYFVSREPDAVKVVFLKKGQDGQDEREEITCKQPFSFEDNNSFTESFKKFIEENFKDPCCVKDTKLTLISTRDSVTSSCTDKPKIDDAKNLRKKLTTQIGTIAEEKFFEEANPGKSSPTWIDVNTENDPCTRNFIPVCDFLKRCCCEAPTTTNDVAPGVDDSVCTIELKHSRSNTIELSEGQLGRLFALREKSLLCHATISKRPFFLTLQDFDDAKTGFGFQWTYYKVKDDVANKVKDDVAKLPEFGTSLTGAKFTRLSVDLRKACGDKNAWLKKVTLVSGCFASLPGLSKTELD